MESLNYTFYVHAQNCLSLSHFHFQFLTLCRHVELPWSRETQGKACVSDVPGLF